MGRRNNTILGAALLDHAAALYTQSRQTFNDILYDTMLKEQVLGPLTKDLVKELIQLVDIASPALAIQKPSGPQAASVFSATTQTTIMTILGAQIAQALALRLGISALSRGALGSVLQVITGPLGTAMLAVSVLVDLYKSKNKTISACKEALWNTYQATYRAYTGRCSPTSRRRPSPDWSSSYRRTAKRPVWNSTASSMAFSSRHNPPAISPLSKAEIMQKDQKPSIALRRSFN